MERWLSWSKAHDWKSCVPYKGTEGSNPSLSAITDTPFDTIVSRGVSLFNREERCDYKSLVVTALHFMVSVAKIKVFLQEWIIQNLKI